MPKEAEIRIGAEIERLRLYYEPYVLRVQSVAEEARALIDAAIDSGAMTLAQLFDTDYRYEEGTDPKKYWNQAVAPLERAVRALVEREIAIQPAPDFCILQDRNGFNPVHNLCYSFPPKPGDLVYNARSSRARRIFDDRVGMAASRNLRPFIVQSYARDMGGGLVALRKEFDAPLFIRGRHWGALRMAYQLT